MHALFGPIKKVDRAQEQLKALDIEIEEFLKADRYGGVVAEFNRRTREHALRLVTTGDGTPPLRWSLDIGEIAFNLRSALDHIAIQLALSVPGQKATDALYEKTQFPICLHGPDSSKRKRWRWKNGMSYITYISRKHRAILQGMQPYSRRDRKRARFGPFRGRVPLGRKHPLWLLREVNNADKHRLLLVTARVVSGMSLIVTEAPKGFKIEHVTFKAGMELIHGAKIGSIRITGNPHDVRMKFGVSPEVVFASGCRAVKGLPVVGTLEAMHDEVDRVIRILAAQFPPLGATYPPD